MAGVEDLKAPATWLASGSACRGQVSVHEAAVVLELCVREVRRLLRRGELVGVRRGRLIEVAVDQLREAVADQPLASAVLEAIIEGRLQVRVPRPDESPPSLIESWDALW